ncbi:MAG: inorganic phosphate transporter [Planctomycetota bacterium]|nr:MAG: inorganic phosphate transporter [Planctomycetota bacterium]
MDFITVLAFIGLALLVWDCIEVGRNDAANIVNAVFGARILPRRVAVAFAGVAVIAGATLATPVMETARKGIFDPGMLGTIERAMIVYISVYLVDTVLLYVYSTFGMPVSTTACLVFELVGASMGVAGVEIVHWDKVRTVVLAIIFSIIMTGIAGFLVQRVFRAAIRDRIDDRETILLHGPWICGLMLTGLAWFMIFKGMKGVALVQQIRESTIDAYTPTLAFLVAWGAATLAVHIFLTTTGKWGAKMLFPGMAVLGMLCLAFAFGQNDLANCASPGLSAFWLWRHSTEEVAVATKIPIPPYVLFACGCLIVGGMWTRDAQRVTRAAVNTGSQFDKVALYAPNWCRAVARGILAVLPKRPELAPPPTKSPAGKKVHYDSLRAAVISSVSAGVIALASSRGLPVSTTYVAFAAVIATGLADRVLSRGDADLKIGRAIWVVLCWFLAAALAVAATAGVARVIFHMGIVGVAIAAGVNLAIRLYAKRRADAQEERVHLRVSKEGGKDALEADQDITQ